MTEQSNFSSQLIRQKAFKFTKQDEIESEKSEESITSIAPLKYDFHVTEIELQGMKDAFDQFKD